MKKITAATATLGLVLVATLASADPYCWISNYDDDIYVENVCVNEGYDQTFVCLSRQDAPKQRVFVTDNGEYSLPCSVPQLDTTTLVLCSPPVFPVINNFNCTRNPLCVAAYQEQGDNNVQSFSLGAPVVRNAPPRAVCARRSDVPNEHGMVVNNDITDFTTSYEWNDSIHGGPPGPDSISVTFYTNRACTEPLGGPTGTINCQYEVLYPSIYEQPCAMASQQP